MAIDIAATGTDTDRIGDKTTIVRTDIAAIGTMDTATDATTATTINRTTITVHIIAARITAIEAVAER